MSGLLCYIISDLKLSIEDNTAQLDLRCSCTESRPFSDNAPVFALRLFTKSSLNAPSRNWQLAYRSRGPHKQSATQVDDGATARVVTR